MLHAYECPLGLCQAERAAMASTWNATASWYSHPAYARYWQHYHHAMAWMRSHQSAFRKAVGACALTPCFCPPALFWNAGDDPAEHAQASYDRHVAWPHAHYGSSRLERQSRGDGRKSHTSSSKVPGVHEEGERALESDEEECGMEISDELRQYFAETEKHREERSRRRRLDAERLGGHVGADHGLYCSPRSAEPPSEPPGVLRQADMKRLYGEHAPKILAMEAAVQLSFDKYYDRAQPKYWPVIPLKF